MGMTKSEIIQSYYNALDPAAQVGILAELTATSKDDIRAILLEAGIVPPKPKRGRRPYLNSRSAISEWEKPMPWTANDEETLKALSAQGRTYTEIAAIMSRSESTVRRRCLAAGYRKKRASA